jgi:hypothetical protein
VDEALVSEYTKTLSQDCSGTINIGETKTCTITNDDIQPKLTVTKVVVNDNGGTKVVSDFPLFVATTSVTSDVQNGFNAGAYTVSETGDPGYAAAISGDCASDGTITLNLGDVKTCTITNDDITPTKGSLNVTKIIINDNDGTKQVNDFNLFVGSTEVVSGQRNEFTAEDYTITETGPTTAYTATFSGNCDENGNITIVAGNSYTCTITNDDIAPPPTPTPIVYGGGGGGGGAPAEFTILEETVTITTAGETSVTITWSTSYPATSQIVFAAEGEEHILDLTKPNYGYAHSTVEDPTMIIYHSVTITGLTPGTTYYYRCVSRGSFAISQEHTFITAGVKGWAMGGEEKPAEETGIPEITGETPEEITGEGIPSAPLAEAEKPSVPVPEGVAPPQGETVTLPPAEEKAFKESLGSLLLASLGAIRKSAWMVIVVTLCLIGLAGIGIRERELARKKKKSIP